MARGPLTPRQLEIAHLVADGRLYKHIAAHFGCSEKTVKTHVGAIAARLSLDHTRDLKVQIAVWVTKQRAA